MKIVTVLGARPQFIKAGSVSREISRHAEIEEIIVHTGQHHDSNMSDIFFQEMKIPRPHHFLGIHGGGHGAMTGRMLECIEEVLLREKPDRVLVYGDTNSTLAGALAAGKLHIPVAHVEAGLRSFNMRMPEEMNRILTDRIGDLLFCPTERAVENLKAEGFGKFGCKIVKSGDVMRDGALFYRNYAKRPEMELPDTFVLATVHRAENTDDEERLRNIFEALEEIARKMPVVLPLHPRTSRRLQIMGYRFTEKNLYPIEPVGYLEMIWLLEHAALVVTDSGGLQKEAFFFHRPCITLRDETEWGELIEHRFNVLAGADREKIVQLFDTFTFAEDFDRDFYGNGEASRRIVETLLEAHRG